MSTGAAVHFIADAHLGADPEREEAPRRQRLHEFLTSLAGRASMLVIVGDLFDFWFEWGAAIPRRHFETLVLLRELRQRGIAIHYLNGNHDFWLGPFLSRELGVITHDGAWQLECQGHRIWIHHGDGLVGGDLGYRVLKRVIRSRAAIGLYRLLHPDLGWALAHRVSRWSRHSREDRVPDTDRLWREIALPRFAAGDDTVMIGHFHQVVERREGAHRFFVLGDWIDTFTAVRLEDGVFTLERHGDD
jgi:UDP-2,3-diacylglucosamine hydrolase